MDLLISISIYILSITIFIVLPFVILITATKKPPKTTKIPKIPKEEEFKGRYGEREIEEILLESDRRITNEQIIKNLYLERENGKTTEIDVILILKNKIFVFESKNYSGWVFGNTRDKYWIQIFPNGKRYNFYNPTWQNYGHIKTLEEKLKNFPNLKYYSIISFGYKATLKDIKNFFNDVHITNYYNIDQKIRELTKDEDYIIDTQTLEIIERINDYATANKTIELKHTRNYVEV